MGELPLEVNVYWTGDEGKMFAYGCTECKKEFLLENMPEIVYCPYCGSAAQTEVQVEYT